MLSLGNIYEKVGRKQDAIATYHAVLVVDPNNRAADAALTRLGNP
jgi:predicted TPR repeat methyltransferase